MKAAICCIFLFSVVASLAFGTERRPPLSQEPRPRGELRKYTDYKPQPPKRVRDDVLRVANNGSFVSRCLLVISCDGTEKNFETITGQDGLTFGITDFATDGGVYEFMKLLNQHYPAEFKAAFGEHGEDLLKLSRIEENNGSGKGKDANDNGLVRFAWLRTGLDQILCNRRLNGLQLTNFRQGKVEPCLREFTRNHFQFEFTLGSMIGVANSGGMRRHLANAKRLVPQDANDREILIAKRMLSLYVAEDPFPGPDDAVYLKYAFGEHVEKPRERLGHRAKRVRQLVTKFPPAERRPFTELGDFSLQPDEHLHAAGAPPAQTVPAPNESADQAASESSSPSETFPATSGGEERQDTNKDLSDSPTPSATPTPPTQLEKENVEVAEQAASAGPQPQPTAASPQPSETGPQPRAAIDDAGRFGEALPANEPIKKWLESVYRMDLENDLSYTFPKLAGKSSCMLKVDRNGSTVGSFLCRNSSGNPNTEIAYFNVARILHCEDIVRRAAPYKLGHRALAEFERLLKSDKKNDPQHQTNRQAILTAINDNPNEMKGAFKSKKPNGILPYDSICAADRKSPKQEDPLMQLVQAEQPMPTRGTPFSIKINGTAYAADALETGRNWSLLLTLDALFGQWDRFSEGNVTVNVDTREGTFALMSTDNGGADLDEHSVKRNLAWFSRYDEATVAIIKQMSAFLKGEVDQFAGYRDRERFILDLGLYLEHSPDQYAKSLARNSRLFLASVKSNEEHHGRDKIYFPLRTEFP